VFGGTPFARRAGRAVPAPEVSAEIPEIEVRR
jgi:hypothetical protein